MPRTGVIRALGALARDGYAALTADAGESERYTELRLRAAALNHEHGWATVAELAAVLPTLVSLRAIESLDSALGQPSVSDLPAKRRLGTPLDEAFTQLSAWATGLRMAYETLEQIETGPSDD